MPKGIYNHPLGQNHHRWKGGLPYCLICKEKLTQYRSPSSIKRGVKQRCRNCYIKEKQEKAKENNRCYKCLSPISRKGHQCWKCKIKSQIGKHFSLQTEWKAGIIPMSHLRNNFGNKFNVAEKKNRIYKGIIYHSKMESLYAKYLDVLLKAKQILKWEGQIPIDIIIENELITRYFCDFKVYYLDGHIEYHEVKGFRTGLFILKKRLVEALHNIKIVEINSKKMKSLQIL